MIAKVVLIFALVAITAGKIPDYIKICKRSDPKVSKCIMESVEHLRPQLKAGIPELDVPGLEPLRISDINVNRGSGRARFVLGLKKVDVFGASDFNLKKLKLDLPNQTYKISVSFPVLRLMGDYNVDAQLLAFPIKGNGRFDANATKCEATGILKGDIVDDKGVQRMHFTDLTLNLKISDYNLRLDHLFGEAERDLNQAVNELLNQNKADMLQIATPFIQAKTSEILLDIANRVVKNFAYDEVFPEN